MAVEQLHNLILESELEPAPIVHDEQQILSSKPKSRMIHITAHQVQTCYAEVLSVVPGFHARPPVLAPGNGVPTSPLTGPPPPPEGYDLILHVGVGRKGGLRVEKQAHKSDYVLADVDDKFAPVILDRKETLENGVSVGESAADGKAPVKVRVRRGFGEGYEAFGEELQTAVDAESLVTHLHAIGFEVSFGHLTPSLRFFCT